MSRVDQKAAMVNYFNSLLTDPSEQAQPKKAEKVRESSSQKEVLEKTFNSESLSRMLENITSEVLAAPVSENSEPAAKVTEAVTEAVSEKTETAVENEVSEPENVIQTAVENEQAVKTDTVQETAPVHEEAADTEETQESVLQTGEQELKSERWCNIETDSEFSALLFKVAGILLAVPLFSLGGIFKPVKIDKLFGKPEWYAGMTCIQKQNVSVVDTAKWMLPGKEIVAHEYNFVILLKSKEWCLQCDELVGTKTIKREDVKWRVLHGDRPWLAGILKKEMCALLHVTELEKMLSKGLDIYMNQPQKNFERH